MTNRFLVYAFDEVEIILLRLTKLHYIGLAKLAMMKLVDF